MHFGPKKKSLEILEDLRFTGQHVCFLGPHPASNQITNVAELWRQVGILDVQFHTDNSRERCTAQPTANLDWNLKLANSLGW